VAESNDGQERTEEPTPKRLQDAREKGQIPRSRELNSFAAVLAASSAFLFMGPSMLQQISDIVREGLQLSRAQAFDEGQLADTFVDTVVTAVLTLAPFFALMVLVAIAASVALGGIAFSSQAIAFKLEKLDPVKGMKRVLGWRGLVEMVKGFAKFVLVASVGLLVLQAEAESLLGLGYESLPGALAHTGHMVSWAFLFISLALLLVVLIDVPFQIWDHKRQLKMTVQEVKEEHKQTDGSPEVKRKIRQLQMEMSTRRMMEAVPGADVVITNPTHFAVAIKYDQEQGDAPVLVAKGVDLVAVNIRTIARENGVPVLEAPPLARALYHSTELNDFIPSGLYRAVAQVLAYVYHLRQGPTYGREGVIRMPELHVPEEFRWEPDPNTR